MLNGGGVDTFELNKHWILVLAKRMLKITLFWYKISTFYFPGMNSCRNNTNNTSLQWATLVMISLVFINLITTNNFLVIYTKICLFLKNPLLMKLPKISWVYYANDKDAAFTCQAKNEKYFLLNFKIYAKQCVFF